MYVVLQNDYDGSLDVTYKGDSIKTAIEFVVYAARNAAKNWWLSHDRLEWNIEGNNIWPTVSGETIRMDWTIFEIEDSANFIVVRNNYYEYSITMLGPCLSRDDAQQIIRINKCIMQTENRKNWDEEYDEEYEWFIYNLK